MDMTEGPRPISNTEKVAGRRAKFHVFYERPVCGKTSRFFDPVFEDQAKTPEDAAAVIDSFLREMRYRNATVTRVHTIVEA